MNIFTDKTNDFLIGIKFNNNKEWFQAHKDDYKCYVHEPMVALANNLADRINEFDKSQILIPRVSRANRDVRFSKNKMPYKIAKWFFLRTSASSRIIYPNPTIFFEATMDWWRYGFFYDPSPKGMKLFRDKIYSNITEAERISDFCNSQKFFTIEGEFYKKIFNKDVSDKVNNLAQRKWIGFTRYEDYTNTDFYSEGLCDIIFENLKEIYPIYDYMNNHNNIII